MTVTAFGLRDVALLTLAPFQRDAVDALVSAMRHAGTLLQDLPDQHDQVALRDGVALLTAPTGSGKTLMLARALEELKGAMPRRTVWFWFAPYAGLVSQTVKTLQKQTPGLRCRDVAADRHALRSRDGDVFVQTWASVATSRTEARRVRRGNEFAVSIDDMVTELRDEGWSIGVVIDEAHVNFGTSAKQAAKFYRHVLAPDFTILATATPRDDRLLAFERDTGMPLALPEHHANRITIDRDSVVQARLNKGGVMLGVIRTRPGDEALIDLSQATLQAGWTQHRLIKQSLREAGLGFNPLMMVQVEDDAEGSSPVTEARRMLLEIGVPEDAIAVHTSGEPDPHFHTLAFDDSKEVLIFKLAVATGFDAPRAWTLVSMRPNRGRDFGLQVVGRIMRVHQQVRTQAVIPPLLDHGYVFLTDPDRQEGLNLAAQELRAVEASIELVTDAIDTLDIDASAFAVAASGLDDVPRQERARTLANEIAMTTAYVIRERLGALPLPPGEARPGDQAVLPFDDLPEGIVTWTRAHERPPAPRDIAYRLRDDLGIPTALKREMKPSLEEIPTIIREIGNSFGVTDEILTLVTARQRRVKVSLRELFDETRPVERRDERVGISDQRIAAEARDCFRFGPALDPRDIKRALVERLRAACDERGTDYEERDLRRTVDLIALHHAELIRDAIRRALANHVRIDESEPLPNPYYGPPGLEPAVKGAYGVFPRMNQEETSFAELLDSDQTGTVMWWLRNQENTRWAARLVLPDGTHHFPDFVVGVSGRPTPDQIALAEVKDDGMSGRLHARVNRDKIRTYHREYRKVLWVYRDGNRWMRAAYNDISGDIVANGRFELGELRVPD